MKYQTVCKVFTVDKWTTCRNATETMFLSAPSPPTFDIVDVGDTYVNVTWEPSTTGNPGSVFYVQYRPRGKFKSDFL